jgi:hypothetical protein
VNLNLVTFEYFFNEYCLQEAISLKNAKKKKLSKKYSGAYTKALNEIFGDKNRLFLDLNIDYSNIEHELMRKIDAVLDKESYTVRSMKSYIDGIAYKYKYAEDGTYVVDTKNPVKIGKLLQKYEPDGKIEVTTRVNGKKTTKKIPGKPLLHEFKNDPIRAANGKFAVVISRHPYDLAGASTDRSWTSCMDLGFERINYPKSKKNEGSNKKFVSKDIDEGSLIAYVVPANELYKGPNGETKTKLEKPLSRITMKPHSSNKGDVYSIGTMYGNKYPEFEKMVEEWISKNLNNKLTGGEAIYRNRNLYSDGDKGVNFEFNTGNELADEIFKEKLSWNNENELDNLISFTTSGDQVMEFEMRIEFDFEENFIKKDFKELDYFRKRDLASIFSPIEKGVASAVISSLRPGGYTYEHLDPKITITNTPDSLNVTLNFSVRLYADDDKFIDNDYLSDVLNHNLDDFKHFDYTKLKNKLYQLFKSYDWDSEENNTDQEIQKMLIKLQDGLNDMPTKINIANLKNLKFIPVKQVLAYDDTQREQLHVEIYQSWRSMVLLQGAIYTFNDRIVPSVIRGNEKYINSKENIIYKWFKATFGVDLMDYKNKMSNEWNYKKFRDISKNENLSADSLEAVKDMHHEIFKIIGIIRNLIGYMGEIKI